MIEVVVYLTVIIVLPYVHDTDAQARASLRMHSISQSSGDAYRDEIDIFIFYLYKTNTKIQHVAVLVDTRDKVLVGVVRQSHTHLKVL